MLFETVLFSGTYYIDPLSGLSTTQHMDTSTFSRTFSETLTEVYSYIQGFYWITIGLAILAFVFSICRYAMSSINNSPRMRDEAKSGLFVSLVILALCGCTPFLFSLILTLFKFFKP